MLLVNAKYQFYSFVNSSKEKKLICKFVMWMDDVTSNDEIISSNAEQVKGQLGYLCDFCYFGSLKWGEEKVLDYKLCFFQQNFATFL